MSSGPPVDWTRSDMTPTASAASRKLPFEVGSKYLQPCFIVSPGLSRILIAISADSDLSVRGVFAHGAALG